MQGSDEELNHFFLRKISHLENEVARAPLEFRAAYPYIYIRKAASLGPILMLAAMGADTPSRSRTWL